MAEALAGKFEHEKNENVLEYFKAIGVPDEVIEKVGKLSPTVEIIVNGNSITIKGSTDSTFEIGKEFDDQVPTGAVLKSIPTLEGGKLVITSTSPDGKKGTRTYEVTADGLIVTLQAEGCPIVGKRYYKKV
ncbi:fatty acid-binding protein, heart-like [Chrysoperla carnea]|uniref:fatty acid-binding protein, heart-like n=1 Tax=Chrysoperla carnea TaxID=189513 RepID=UPI001D06E6A3|nr:fatty acid-binding protein, heart-like [Chrysoperla carnea]